MHFKRTKEIAGYQSISMLIRAHSAGFIFLTSVTKFLPVVHKEGGTVGQRNDSSFLKSSTSLLSSSENMAIIFPP